MAEADSDEDLTKELQPLAYHVSERKRVLREAFKALKGKRLEAMIPPNLKMWSRETLERECLEVLDDVDDETLLAVLDGRVGTAGVAAVEQPVEPVKMPGVKIKKKEKLKKKLAKAMEEVVADGELKKKKKKKAVVLQNQADAKVAKLKKKKKLAKAKAKEKLKKKKKSAAVESAETPAVAPHKSLMELLELEYRAKAIKALLRSQGQTVPDLPINIEDENSNVEIPAKQDRRENQSQVHINGDVNNETKSTPVNSVNKKRSTVAKSKCEVPAEEPVKKKKKPVKSVPKEEVATSQKSALVTKKVPAKPQEIAPVKEPKKVIDLIDEALNTSFSGETAPVSCNEDIKPSVIVDACKRKDIDSEALRSKLLQKFQNQRKKKRKKVEHADIKEQEDILDLHPQELNLTDEERMANLNSQSCTGSESSEASESENEAPSQNQIVQSESSQIVKDNATKIVVEEEELIYDEATDEEEEVSQPEAATVENSQHDIIDADEATNKSNSQSSIPEQDDIQMTEDKELLSDSETKDEPLSENSRSGVFSETTRDDVFESAAEGGTAFAQSSKRKITFRIDPARIGALEEQAVEDKARIAEERKREEEERRKENEVEEGEIDSNEEFVSDTETITPAADEPVGRQASDRGEKRSPVRTRSVSNSDEDSNDSQESTSYYSRKRSYKKNNRKQQKERDFGTYSPKQTMENTSREELPKRPSSPVEFITQFSDMEPISDDDSEHSGPVAPKKRADKSEVLPVHGCAEKPLGSEVQNPNAARVTSSSDEDENDKEASTKIRDENVNENSSEKPGSNKVESESGGEDGGGEDELPKPITWYERWAKSHGMQKVAKTNKIHKKVRSKLKANVSSSKKKPIEIPKVDPSIEAEPIIGSIQEYEKLFGKKLPAKDADTDPGSSTNNNVTVEKSSDDTITENNDDDDADDDLWGDILGGS